MRGEAEGKKRRGREKASVKMDVGGLVFLPERRGFRIRFIVLRDREGGAGGWDKEGGGQSGGGARGPSRPRLIFRFHREDLRLHWQ